MPFTVSWKVQLDVVTSIVVEREPVCDGTKVMSRSAETLEARENGAGFTVDTGNSAVVPIDAIDSAVALLFVIVTV
jgi:hypothetical protein